MFSALRQNVSGATLFQLAAELSWLFAAIVLALQLDSKPSVAYADVALLAFVFAVTLICLNGAFGLYRRTQVLSTGAYFVRVILAPAIGIPLAFLVAHLLPVTIPLHDDWSVAIVLALLGLLLVRHAVVLPLVAALLPHRVLVLGTGPEARLVEASLTSTNPLGMRLVGFYALEKIAGGRRIARTASLRAARRSKKRFASLSIDEMIVAVRQQRGGVLPLRALLDCRLNGVQVTDLARYFERVHGQVPIESLKVSWLIYGHGFRQNLAAQRSSSAASTSSCPRSLIVIALPIVLVAAAADRGRRRRSGDLPAGARRPSRPDVHRAQAAQHGAGRGEGRQGGAGRRSNDARVTRVGRLIRRARIDELPQLLNVLKGEMSFVGPRPERPEFVAMLTEQIPFYAVRHSVKPGLTGWAQVRYSYGATVEQSVRKLEYDLYYVKNHTLLLDLVILLETVRVVLLGEGAR